jgi:Na+/melibiose symporter-like transporter
MTDRQKAELSRALKHMGHYLFWMVLAMIPLSFLTITAACTPGQTQFLTIVVSIAIMVLTTPPKLPPDRPDPKDLKP